MQEFVPIVVSAGHPLTGTYPPFQPFKKRGVKPAEALGEPNDGARRLQRLLEIRELLNPVTPMTLRSLALEFGVSQRTMYRDLATLRQSGLPIEYVDGVCGYILKRPSVDAFKLTPDQALGLWIAVNSATETLLPHLLAAAQSAVFAAMSHCLPEHQQAMRAISEAFAVSPGPSESLPTEHTVFEQLLLGAAQGRHMRILFRRNSDQEVQSTRLWPPCRFHYFESDWWITARSSLQRDRWSIRIDEICAVEVLISNLRTSPLRVSVPITSPRRPGKKHK